MSNRPWMPLYVADFHTDTAHLNAAETGAYILLIMHYWQKGGLPNDDATLARIARTSPRQWRNIKRTLKSFFHGRWKHKRIDKELAHVLDISQKRSASAQQMLSNRAAKYQQKHTHSHSHSDSQKKESIEPPLRGGPAVELPFDKPPNKQNGRHPPAATYTDDRHELFHEGKLALVSLGVNEKQAGSMIGKWLRDAGDDCRTVMDAIRAAEKARVMEPIPWITKALVSRVLGRPGRNGFLAVLEDLMAQETRR